MYKIEDIIKASAGRLICGSAEKRIESVSIDSRTLKRNEVFVAVKGYNFDGHDFVEQAVFKGATCVICKAGVDKNLLRRLRKQSKNVSVIEVEDTVKALGDIARFRRKVSNVPVIAITGSSGKTTTKEMLAWVLSSKFKVLKNEGTQNNNIGVALTLLKIDKTYDMAVIELGTNHFGEIENLVNIALPNIGIITNIGQAHLEYFGDLSGVFKEKITLLRSLKAPHIGIVNADDDFLRKELLSNADNPVMFGYGFKNKADFKARCVKSGFFGLKFSLFKGGKKYGERRPSGRPVNFALNTIGGHNIYNALAVISAARIFGMEYKDIALRLSDFKFPKGRLNLLTENNVRFIDDTYNSNPLSLEYALETLNRVRIKGRKIFVMGDMLELGAKKESLHAHVGHLINKICDVFISVGKLAGLSADSAASLGFDTRNIFTCVSCNEAKDVLFNKLSPNKNDIVLVKGSRDMKMEEIF